MSSRLGASLRERLEGFARELGVSWDDIVRATTQRPIHATPGKTVDGEKPLAVGSLINLRRGHPGTREAANDQGWVVAGYTRRSDGRWTGYELRRGPWQLEANTASRAEAVDVVELAP